MGQNLWGLSVTFPPFAIPVIDGNPYQKEAIHDCTIDDSPYKDFSPANTPSEFFLSYKKSAVETADAYDCLLYE